MALNVERVCHVTLEGAGGRIQAVCPQHFVALLQATLNGWSITPSNEPHPCVDIMVSYKHQIFQIDALVLDGPRRHTDMIDALNEFFLCLCYQLCAQKKDTVLLHCAAFVEGGKNHILVGQKNRGKSTLTYKKAVEGTKILSDDLLLWDVPKGRFTTLGLPLRMRRPLYGAADHPEHRHKFLAGKSIAYSRTGGFNIAPVGESFALDALFELSAERIAKRLGFLQLRPALRRFRIAAEYCTLKKDCVPWEGADGENS